MRFWGSCLLVLLLPLAAWGADWQLLSYYQDGGYTYLDHGSIRQVDGIVHYTLKKEFEDSLNQENTHRQQASELAGEPVDAVLSHYRLNCRDRVVTLVSYAYCRQDGSLIGNMHEANQSKSFLPSDVEDYYFVKIYCPADATPL